MSDIGGRDDPALRTGAHGRGAGTRLTTAQADRAAGVLLGQACGDALGVPYEFGPTLGADELAVMKGGGLGHFAPGEWSDDTAMAVAVAEGAGSLDEIAERFVCWYDEGPADIGIQTSAVLRAVSARLRAGEEGPGRIATEEATAYAARHSRSAGNGALMRTSPVALAHLDDRQACAAAARAIAGLTHADPLAGDSCVLWSEAIRVAVLTGTLDVVSGLDLVPQARRETWDGWITDARLHLPSRFTPNGYTVTAFQAALSAIVHTPAPAGLPGRQLQDALHAAVRIGDDTDTVAAIAGGLLGALWGASAVPASWREAVHGWPGRHGHDLVDLATSIVEGGEA